MVKPIINTHPSIMLVGGTFDANVGKASGIVKKMMNEFGYNGNSFVNGGSLNLLKMTNVKEDIENAKLLIWMPNIDNEEEKDYPKKGTGSVLICSKVIREGYTYTDAIARIFKMHGNAVIAIEKDINGVCTFTLIDALGNHWYSGNDISKLCNAIFQIYTFMSNTIRKGSSYDVELTKQLNSKPEDLNKFISLNNKLANHIMTSCGNRFFGNISTRCQKLFPSTRNEYNEQTNCMFVSHRNSNKLELTADDFVLYNPDNSTYASNNGNKPSVDSPVQGEIYKALPTVNYMIHGHAFITAPNDDIRVVSTDNYYPCGDMREVNEVYLCMKHIITSDNKKYGVVNLTGHGFTLFSETLEQMEYMINSFTNESFRMNDGKSWNKRYEY